MQIVTAQRHPNGHPRAPDVTLTNRAARHRRHTAAEVSVTATLSWQRGYTVTAARKHCHGSEETLSRQRATLSRQRATLSRQ